MRQESKFGDVAIWGTQLTSSASPTPFTSSTSPISLPRFAYLDSKAAEFLIDTLSIRNRPNSFDCIAVGHSNRHSPVPFKLHQDRAIQGDPKAIFCASSTSQSLSTRYAVIVSHALLRDNSAHREGAAMNFKPNGARRSGAEEFFLRRRGARLLALLVAASVALCVAVFANAGQQAPQAAASPSAGTATSAKVSVPKLDLRDTKLDNGLRVILVPDHSAPVYSIDVAYNVGSRNEGPGHTGFAHLFEHMMFQGSENVGKGDNMNGTTTEDRTTYFEELPKNQLDLGLFLESDRMRALNITQANLDNQRNAVQEERRQGIDNQPYGRAELDIDSMSYDNFAYKHSVIGSMTDLDAASIQDVKDFFRIYYAPNNAVVTLVGDFDPDDALARIKKFFGSIPSQPAPPKVDLAEETHYGERSETIYDPLARQPRIYISYRIPPGNTSETYAASQLAMILGEGQSSRFYQHLVKDKQLATQISIDPDPRIGPGLLYITATPRPGVKMEDLQKGIDDELAAAVTDGVTPEELAKAKTRLLRSFVDQRRSSLSTAIRIGDDVVKYGDPNLVNTQLDKENAVTLEQVNAAAKKFLVRDQRATVITLPASQDPSGTKKVAQ
jgi:predicted Zn-dependent peptidase